MITSLTEEQVARMPEFREKWRGYGLSCEPADRQRAELGIVEVYRAAGLPTPQILWCQSPRPAALAIRIIGNLSNGGIRRRVKNAIKKYPKNRVEEYVRDYVTGEIYVQEDQDDLLKQVTEIVLESIEVGIKVGPNLHQDYTVTHDMLKSTTESVQKMMSHSVWESVNDKVRGNWLQGASEMIFGNIHKTLQSVDGYKAHEWEKLGIFDYFNRVLGFRKETKNLNGLWTMAQSAGWFWTYANICWISERPERIHLDDHNRIHNLSGPALSFRDGFKIYAFHGVTVPQWVIEKSCKIDPSEIAKEDNAEIRRTMIELFGQARYLKETGGILISSDSCGRLWRKELWNDEAIVMIELLNSTPERDGSLSVREAIATFGEDAQVNHDGMMMRLGGVPDGLRFKSYFLRVPPECRTPKEAVAWTFDKKDDEYDLAIQS